MLEHRPISPRSLLDRPQRFGILPTMWFWNDRERQILLLPLTALTIMPAGYVLAILVIHHQLSPWLIPGFALLSPLLLMGIVERHLRRIIGRLPLDERLDHAASPRSGGRLFPTVLASGCAVTAMLLAYELVRPTTAMLVLVGVLVSCSLPRTWRALLERREIMLPSGDRARAPSRGGELPCTQKCVRGR